MKVVIIIGLIAIIVGLISCKTKTKEKTDKEIFEEVLNDPRVNSKEVGEREGIKYFQVTENGKTGFRDLDGNIVIKPIFDNAEIFSEGLSTVQIGKKYGLIDEAGRYVLPLQDMEYLGSVHNGLASFRVNDKHGFIDTVGQQKIKPQFEWVGEFSERLCVVRNDKGKHGYTKKNGWQFDWKFELNQPEREVYKLTNSKQHFSYSRINKFRNKERPYLHALS